MAEKTTYTYFRPQEKKPLVPSSYKRWAAVLLFGIFLLSIVCSVAVWFLFRMYDTLPTLAQLSNIEPPLASKVYARDGSRIHEFSTERRFWMPLEKIPANLIHAAVSIEDRRFYKHWGIDIHRIAGALAANLLRGGIAQGGSTITQQLARNVYLTAQQSMVRKIREAMTAVQIEKYYTKDQIMELYLNQVYFGAGMFGVQAASLAYFSKPVTDLSLNECATMAGIIQLPEYYRPDKPANLKRTMARRNAVLHAMREMHYIDASAFKEASASEVPSNPMRRTPKIGPYFIEMVRQYLEQKYGEDRLYNGGLNIFTTLDPVAQDTIDRAVRDQMKQQQTNLQRLFLNRALRFCSERISYDNFMEHFDSLYQLHRKDFEGIPDSLKLRVCQGAVVALDVSTGAIRALTGGKDFEASKFNRATQAQRQIGSAIKPIVYTAAIENRYTPVSIILDQPITLMTPQGEWRPENYERDFSGSVTLRRALEKSINLPAIQVTIDVGPEKVVAYARKMGLNNKMDAVPSLAVGSCEVIPINIIRAYGVFPNHGLLIDPFFIDSIVDKTGLTIERATVRQAEALSPQTAYMMCNLLQGVVQRGTGASIPQLGFSRPSAGKTGTTNEYSDAWYIGFTPQLVCGVWVGTDERRSLGRGVTGAQAAIPIWVRAMKALHRSLPVEQFDRPSGIVNENICVSSYKLATHYCPKTITETFMANNLPDSCSIHGPRAGSNGSNPFGSSQRNINKKKSGRRLVY